MARQKYLLFLLSLCTHHAFSYNILAIISLPLRSHYMAMHPLFRELAARGHHVTVMNNFPEENIPKTMQFVDLGAGENAMRYFTPMKFWEEFDSTYLHLYNFYRHLELTPISTRDDCKNLLTNENVTALLAKGVKYDVIFVEMFGGDCGLAFAGALFDAPIIGITSHVMKPTAYPRLGLPFDFSADAFYFSKSGPNPNLYQRIEALIMNFMQVRILKWFNQKSIYEIFNRYLPNNSLDVEKVARERVKMFFAYQHFSLTGARVLAPQVLEIGGIHISPPKPVPWYIDEFLSDADQGAIYVSFGSNLKAKDMTPNKTQEFIDVFMKIPQKVIWKNGNEDLKGNDKIFIDNWFPQLDILCHPKIIGFVSHAGMLSLSETTHCGKPAVVVPFFGDQFTNAATAEHIGIAKILHFQKLNKHNLVEAIREITLPRMQQNAKRISRLWHDRPISVMDSAIYWTEYVVRNRDSDFPPSLPSKQSMWYETMLIDVALVLLAIIAIPIIMIVALIKLLIFIVRKVFSKKIMSKEKKKTKKA